MLTSTASQYLHPDYLQPLPTTLDAKKSPLALLAQTCSNIGKDTTPAKPIIPPIDKKEHGRHSSDRTSGGGHESEKRVSSTDKKDDSKSRKTPPKELQPLASVASSSDKRSSPSSSLRGSPVSDTHTTVTSGHSVNASAPPAGSQSNSHINLSCGNVVLEVKNNESMSTSLPKSGVPSVSSHQPLPGATLKPTPVSSSISSSLSNLGSYMTDQHILSHQLSLDATMQSAYASALAAHAAHAGYNMLKPGEIPGLSTGVSPYVAYAQVKTAAGATTLVPICRDPYCTNCQLTMRSAQLGGSSCGAGCTQCTHDKPGMPILPLSASTLGASAGLSSLGCSLYPHSVLPPTAHHGPGLPYVCNWMSGNEHCGKRFSTSDDLLHHLRTHTSSDVLQPTYSLSPSISSLGTYPHLTASNAGSISPSSLHRYPTSLSPLSSAISASRYHPYKTGLASLAPSAPLPVGIGAYYSPYSIYGSRLGHAAVP